MEAGTEAQKAQWRPKMASGEARVGVGVQQLVSNRDGSGLLCTDGKLTGAALFVLDREGADYFLVADQTGRLHIVSVQADGLQLIDLKTIDATRSVGDLRLASTQAEALSDDGGAAGRRVIAPGRVCAAEGRVGAGEAR